MLYSKFFLTLLILIITSILQLSFIPNLPGFFGGVNLILVALVFILMLEDFNYGIIWAVGAGIIFEFYSFLPAGIYLTGFFLTLILVNFFLTHFFTNRSLYSIVALATLAILIYKITTIIYIAIDNRFAEKKYSITFDKFFFGQELKGLAINIFLAVVIFYLVNFFSRRFRPVFINKT